MPKLHRKIAAVELANGEIHEVRITAADTVRYEETAQRHRWPNLVVKDGSGTMPHLNHQERFEIWAALKRLDLYAGTWEMFKDTDLIDYTVEVESVDPTPPEPGTD